MVAPVAAVDMQQGSLRTTATYAEELWIIMQKYVLEHKYLDGVPLSSLGPGEVSNMGFGKDEGDKIRLLGDYLANDATWLRESMVMPGFQGVVNLVLKVVQL